MAETIEDLLFAIASPVVPATKAFTGPALQYLPGLTGFFAVSFAISYIAWGLYGLSGKKRGTLSSCDISILHGLLTCTLGFWQLSSNFPFSLDAPNNASTNLIMQLSAAYMAVDFFMFLIPFTPGDYLFVGHHIMTFGYMISSLVINRGGLSCLILMVLGESTSLFQNSWLISRELRRDSNVALRAFEMLSPIYTYVFLFVRSVVAPPVVVWFAMTLMAATKLPFACRATWASFAVLTVAGSQMWSYKLWRGLKKQSAIKQAQTSEAAAKIK
ncbi:hypothetical protein ABBQ32_007570 [Trebouxia sp. C0010 RCD-2024]